MRSIPATSLRQTHDFNWTRNANCSLEIFQFFRKKTPKRLFLMAHHRAKNIYTGFSFLTLSKKSQVSAALVPMCFYYWSRDCWENENILRRFSVALNARRQTHTRASTHQSGFHENFVFPLSSWMFVVWKWKTQALDLFFVMKRNVLIRDFSSFRVNSTLRKS